MMKKNLPWIGRQNWQDVLFIHIPASPEQLRPFVPMPLQLDTYQGQAWFSIVLFQATHTRLRGFPHLLSYPAFFQINVRTYVHFAGLAGVYFLNMYTNHKLFYLIGKYTSLPYETLPIKRKKYNNGRVHISLTHDRLNTAAALMYIPTEKIGTSVDSLAHFLTERYYMWLRKKDKVIKVSINHSPWQLQSVNINMTSSFLSPFRSCYRVDKPVEFYYSPVKHATIFPYEQVALWIDD